MATGKSGSFALTVSSTNNISGRVTWSETYDVAKNTSDVTVNLQYMKANTGIATYSSAFKFYIKVGTNQQDFTVSHTFPAGGEGWTTLATRTVKGIAHNTDGAYQMRIWGGGGDSSTTGLSSSSGTATIQLTTIPRAATITSASNTYAGSAVSVKWTPKLSSHRFKLKFSLGSYSYTTGVIYPGSTSAYTYNSYSVPTTSSFLSNISGSTGTMTVTLYTYSDSSGTTQIGSASSTTFTVTVKNTPTPTPDPTPTDVRPTVSSASVAIDNSHDPNFSESSLALQGVSKVRVRATASAQGTDVVSYTISGGYNVTVTPNASGQLDYVGSIMQNAGTFSFSVTATDSRGNTSSARNAGSVTILSYHKPQINEFSVNRSQDDNTKMILKADWTISNISGNTLKSVVAKYRAIGTTTWTTLEDEIEDNVPIELSHTFSTNVAYDFSITVTDNYNGATTATLSSSGNSFATIHKRAGGNGIALGKVSEIDGGAEVNFDAYFYKDINVLWPPDSLSATMRSIFDILLPVGTIIERNDNTNPATLYGVGSWQQFGQGKFLVGAGSSLPETGGSETHTHTIDHSHDLSGVQAESIPTPLRSHGHNIRRTPLAVSTTSSDWTATQVNTTGSALSGSVVDTGDRNSNHGHSLTGSISSSGVSSGSASSLPPYVTVYRWVRVS